MSVWWQDPIGRVCVVRHSEYVQGPSQQQSNDDCLSSASPGRHHNSSCYSDGRSRAVGRQTEQPLVGRHVGGLGLVRSRSDETLANPTPPPTLPQRRRSSTVRRRKKQIAADRLISDFNDGKEVDLDCLTAGGSTRRLDFAAPAPLSTDADGAVSAEAGVRSWLQSQNGGLLSTKWVAPVTNYNAHGVHHLWIVCLLCCLLS